MTTEDSKIRLHGTIVFLKENEGSKSEAVVPYLYQNRDMALRKVMLKDDNPFENNGFAPYDGKSVEVSGEVALSGTFIVDEVVLSSDVQR